MTFQIKDSQAQINSTQFEAYSQSLINPYLINPSAYDTTYQYKAGANYINEMGLFRGVRRFLFDLDYKHQSTESQQNHFFGVQGFSHRLGDFISRNKFHLRYSRSLRLSKQSSLSAGLSLGIVSYTFKTSTNASGGSDYTPDGSLGMRLTFYSFSLGGAINQIFQSTIQPIDQTFVLNRLYTFDLIKLTRLNRNFLIETQIASELNSSSLFRYSLSGSLVFYENFRLGYSYHSIGKSSVQFGFEELHLQNNKLDILFIYGLYHNTILQRDNVLEVYLALKI